ncbi:MAG: hypothetical protein K1X75_04085 [Leptospirales bacterium]|nr:hypothetical protein [Leptospirales bacterium]
MASKKDKLIRAARHQVEESVGKSQTPPPASLGEFVREVDASRRGAEASVPPAAGSSPSPPAPAAGRDAAAEALPPRPPSASENSMRPGSADSGDSAEIDLPQSGARSAFTASWRKAPGRSMARSRESIYNVSSDIRLDDYTEAGGGGGSRFGGILRFGGGAAGLAVLIYLVYLLWGWITGPDYQLAIANELIDPAQMEQLDDEKHPVVSSGNPVYIRFDWGESALESDYLKIDIFRGGPDGEMEAELGRRPPVSAHYIYFMGPLDAGEYAIRVTNREGDTLREKTFTVR